MRSPTRSGSRAQPAGDAESLGWGLGYNLLAMPLAAGVLYPHFPPAAKSNRGERAAMAFGSVIVVMNSLRCAGSYRCSTPQNEERVPACEDILMRREPHL